MGFWYHIDFSISFDKRSDDLAFLILLDRHLFSVITNGYKKENNIEVSLSKIKEDLGIGLLKEEVELVNGINIKLSCSGSLDKGYFEEQLVYCLNYFRDYNDLGKAISNLNLKIEDVFWSGHYVYNSYRNILNFIDNEKSELNIINLSK